MSFNLKQITMVLMMLIISTWPCSAADQKGHDAIKIVSDYTYKVGAKDTKEKSRALALFGAKIKAVALAAKYLTYKGILDHYEKKQHGIFCLATNEIHAFIIEEKYDQDKMSYYVKIKAEITNTDFIKAQIKNLELHEKESRFSYGKEMEQPVSEKIDPGEELSRAYRYIMNAQWRISIIYLDHLEKKYPYWGDVYLAKAIAFYGMDKIDEMVDALNTSCSLNNQEACDELLSFSAK